MLDGQVAVVIGGGSGIGAACARQFAAAGARIAIVDLQEDAAAVVAAPLGGHAYGCDIGDEDSVRQCRSWIEEKTGPVDIMINTAAIFQAPVPPSALKMERWDAVTRVALRGAYLAATVFGEAMAARGHGAIVNIASVVGTISSPYHAYGPAKAGVISMTQSLAAEWGPAGVRINAISPGFTLTPSVQVAIDRGTGFAEAVAKETPMGRFVEPDEVARAAVFLASPAASGITGVNLPVDCGWSAGIGWQAYGGLRGPGRE